MKETKNFFEWRSSPPWMRWKERGNLETRPSVTEQGRNGGGEIIVDIFSWLKKPSKILKLPEITSGLLEGDSEEREERHCEGKEPAWLEKQWPSALVVNFKRSTHFSSGSPGPNKEQLENQRSSCGICSSSFFSSSSETKSTPTQWVDSQAGHLAAYRLAHSGQPLLCGEGDQHTSLEM